MTRILNLKEEWRDCIDACASCHNVCVETVAYSLHEGGELSGADHLIILQDCIDICQASVNSMSRKSDLANKICALCANVCDICAEHCKSFDDPKMQDCAEVCESCAEQCLEMAQVPA